MASIAIDVLDLSWRLLQGEKKPCTHKGWRLIHCNRRRARGDNCHDRESSGEGRRIHAVEREQRRIDLRRVIPVGSVTLPSAGTDMRAGKVLVVEMEPSSKEDPIEDDLIIRPMTPGMRRPVRAFDPTMEARRDALRSEIRDLELRLLVTLDDEKAERLERRIGWKQGRLRRLEGALRTVAIV